MVEPARGLGLELPGPPFALRDAGRVAEMAEDAGFDALFASEDLGDSLAYAQAAIPSTHRIKVGTAIANVYLRHPKVVAAWAAAMHEASEGRLVLGLGVGGRRLDDPWARSWRSPLSAVRDYVAALRTAFQGRPPPPIYLAARGPNMSRLAGQLAEGVIFHLLSPARLREALIALRHGEQQAGRSPGSVVVSVAQNVLVTSDVASDRSVVRSLLTSYVEAGYATDIVPGAGEGTAEVVSDAVVDELTILGTPASCRKQLAELYDLGVQLPILSPLARPGEWPAAAGSVLETFGRPERTEAGG